MKKIYLILLLLFSLIHLNGQNEGMLKNEIGLSLGYNSGYFKDLNYSVLNYDDRGINSQFYYNRRFQNAKLKTSLELHYDNVHTDFAPFFSTVFPRGILRAEYLFDIKKNDKLNLAIGPVFASDNQMLLFNNFLSFSYLFVQSLGLSSDLSFDFDDKNAFGMSVQLPLVYLLARPPYNGYDKETEDNAGNPFKLISDGVITSFDKYLVFNAALSYKRVLNRRFDLIGTYQLHFQRTFQSEYLIHLQNRYTCTINYKF